MSKTLTLDPTAGDTDDFQAAITRCFSEMDRLFKRIRRDQVEIEESETRTRAMLAEVLAELKIA